MGKRGRYGKYGEIKRLERLRSFGRGLSPKAWAAGEGPAGKVSQRTPPIRVRPAKPQDRAFIADLSRAVFSVYGPYTDTVTDWFDSGHAIAFVALESKAPMGFVMMGHLVHEEEATGHDEVLAIAVRPDKRRMGIGERLLQEAEAEALRRNIPRLFLHTAVENLAAQRLFLKAGFRPLASKSNFYPHGQDALSFVKEFRPWTE